MRGAGFRRWSLALGVLAVVAAGCGDDDSGGGDAAAPTTQPTTEATGTTQPPPEGEPIRFAVVAAVAGVVGQPEIFDAADAAVDAVNAAGGIPDPAGGPNRPLEVVRCEAGAGGSTSPDAALECAQDTIPQGVIAVLSKYLVGADGTQAWAGAGIPLLGTVPIEVEDFLNDHQYPLTGGAAVLSGGVAAALQAEGAQTIALVTGDIPAGRALPAFLEPASAAPTTS